MRVRYGLRYPNKNGRTAIYASITYSGKRVIVFPHESIEPRKWSTKAGWPKSTPENAPLHARLIKSEAIFRQVYDDFLASNDRRVPDECDFKDEIQKRIDPIKEIIVKPTLSIVDAFQLLIDDSISGKRLSSKRKAISVESTKPYTSTKRHFEDFQLLKRKQYLLEDISSKLIDDFDNYLCLKLKLSENAAGKYMKTLKTCIGYMRALKLVSANILVENRIHVRKERSDSIYLNENEIQGLLNVKGLTESEEKVRDLFVVGCYTGLRFGDYSKLSQSQISQSYITLYQRKTGDRVMIPIHPIVKQILTKYPNWPKSKSMQNFNSDIKKIAEKVPELCKAFEKKITRGRETIIEKKMKWELVSSHTARRSFATNEYLNKTPVLTIMAITGHRTQQSFMTYIKATDEEHADLLQKEWDKRTNAEERKNKTS